MRLYQSKDSVTGGNLFKGFESDVLNAGLSSSSEVQVLCPQVVLSFVGTPLVSSQGGASHSRGPPGTAQRTWLQNFPLIPFSLLLCLCSVFLFFSPNGLFQFSSPFLCLPFPCLSSRLGAGLPQHCSGGLCLFHHSRLKTNNNRKCKKRKYLLVWHGLH